MSLEDLGGGQSCQDIRTYVQEHYPKFHNIERVKVSDAVVKLVTSREVERSGHQKEARFNLARKSAGKISFWLSQWLIKDDSTTSSLTC